MAPASKDLFLKRRNIQAVFTNSAPVKAATKIYQDVFVGLDGANARGLVAGDTFMGIARKPADNTSGAAGDKIAETESGLEAILNVAGSTNRVPGTEVFASDDQTATVTEGSNSPIGVLTEQIATTQWYVKLYTLADLAVRASVDS